MNFFQIAVRMRAYDLFLTALFAVIDQRTAEGRPVGHLLDLLNNAPSRFNHT